ncbi:MAG: radical SAM protein [Planctomycetota bacterium]|nr:radical SAM protein [Planctomycetota bacterium]
MTDILLAHGYFLFEDEKEQQIMKPYPPLGLLYLSAWLKQSGFDVEIFDTTFRTRSELEARLQADTGILGLYTNLTTRRSILNIVDSAKQSGWTVILGGPESANYPQEYLARGADVIVIGEGESTTTELLPAIKAHGVHRLHDVRGIAFQDESGQVVRTPDREKIADLDSIPWPDRESIDLQQYIDVWRRHHNSGSVNLITARGCPYKCRWCSHAVFGFTHRRRSVLNCADEVEHIRDRYHPDQVWYADDVFTINHRWLFDYARELKRRQIHLPFETISRADRMMDDNVLQTLAEMGCYRVWIGSESGSQRILDRMERGVTVEQVQWACSAARRHGIQVGMFLMWGYDGETLDDMEATVEHVKACNPDTFFTTVAYPIKNTKYFEDVSDTVRLDREWDDATDRDYKVDTQQSQDCYRHADRWLNSAVKADRELDPQVAARMAIEAQTARSAVLESWSHA